MRLAGIALTLLLAACTGHARLPGASPNPSFAVEPYLMREASGLWVVWRAGPETARAANELELFAHGARVAPVGTQQDGDLHRARLPTDCGESGLAYRVVGMPARRAIRLPPCSGAESVEFAFITDTQQDIELVHQLSRRVPDTADFVLHGGDMVQRGGSDVQWLGYHAASSPFSRRIATASTIGNHEGYWDDDYSRFRSYFSNGARETWYAFSSGPVDVLVLNSEDVEDPATNSAQLVWLERTLAGLAAAPDADRRWRVVLTHHAPFSSSLANAWFVPIGRSRQLREEYVPLFERYGVDLVLAGHAHIYERSRRRGVEYLVGGPAGGLMGLLGADNPHSITLAKDRTLSHFEIDAETLTLRTENVHGAEIDRLRLRRSGGVVRESGALDTTAVRRDGAAHGQSSADQEPRTP